MKRFLSIFVNVGYTLVMKDTTQHALMVTCGTRSTSFDLSYANIRPVCTVGAHWLAGPSFDTESDKCVVLRLPLANCPRMHANRWSTIVAPRYFTSTVPQSGSSGGWCWKVSLAATYASHWKPRLTFFHPSGGLLLNRRSTMALPKTRNLKSWLTQQPKPSWQTPYCRWPR